MKVKNSIKLFLTLFAVILLASCVPKKLDYVADDLNPSIKDGQYSQRIENFLVIFDNSSSMFLSPDRKIFSPDKKLDTAKNIALKMNETIPDLDLTAGFRIFGGWNKLLYGMGPYEKTGFASAVNSIQDPIGYSPLEAAIFSGAEEDLVSTNGEIAVIIVSDGEDMDSKPVEMAKHMKNRYQDRLCIYTIQVGVSTEGANLLDQITKAGQCGFSTTSANLSTPVGMTHFVQQVFLKKGKGLDSDGDGVIDRLDKCPGTPKGIEVDDNGCPKDSDKDGIFDYLDECPNTPFGLKVDSRGCPVPIKESVSITLLVEFDFDKSDVKSKFRDHLSGVADFLKKYPDTQITLEGHTDHTGTEEYNFALSERRAMSVKKYLVTNFGSNKTMEGRQKNRRVIAEINTEATK